MMERTTSTTVTFQRPFKLAALDSELPAGSYDVETVEELLDTVSSISYRRKSTTMTVERPDKPGRQVVEIDPADLSAALERDRDLP